MVDCIRCGRSITSDEVGLSKKLTGRATTKYYCITCLATDFGVTEQRLREKIEEFRAEGCTLFAPKASLMVRGAVESEARD